MSWNIQFSETYQDFLVNTNREVSITNSKATEYVGKMNFYLSLLDKLEKAPDENPSIGIILCAEKDHLEVELALQDVNKPIGVAEYQYLLPKNKLQELVANEMKSSCNDED